MAAAPNTLRILVVDDEPAMREVVKAALSQHDGIEVVGAARDGAEAVELARTLEPDIVVIDVNMPRLDGAAATELILKERPATRVVALTGHVAPRDVTRMILAGAVGYAVKGADPDILCQVVMNAARGAKGFVDPAALPDLFDSVVELAREERNRREEAERLAAELQQSYQETVRALVTALQSRDHETEEHGDRVADRVTEVGRKLGMEDERLEALRYGALFHDIGKIGVPDSILHNEDELTEEEWLVIKQHTVVGENIIRPVGFLRHIAPIVRHSHEHWDGSGYPDGLAGEAIPLESRVIFACDAFDAMTSDRSYQQRMPPEEAQRRMRDLSGVRFDPEVVDALDAVIAEERALRQQEDAEAARQEDAAQEQAEAVDEQVASDERRAEAQRERDRVHALARGRTSGPG